VRTDWEAWNKRDLSNEPVVRRSLKSATSALPNSGSVSLFSAIMKAWRSASSMTFESECGCHILITKEGCRED
jgi:hypothetical protein